MSIKNIFFPQYPQCTTILEKNYDLTKITLNKYKLDPFFNHKDEKNYKMDKLLDWYLRINPYFVNTYDLNPSIIEYECLISGIIKDMFLSINNQEKKDEIIEILNIIEECIINNYKYIYIISILEKYIKLFQITQTPFSLEKFKKRCIIIFPSFHQLNLHKRIFNITAPVFNFLITNKIVISHGAKMNSGNHLEHNDIHYSMLIPKEIKILDSDSIYLYFKFMSELLKNLEEYFIYNNTVVNNIPSNEYMCTIILFFLFHEANFFQGYSIYIQKKNLNKIKERNESNKKIFSKILPYSTENPIINIKDLLKNNFLLKCRKLLINNKIRNFNKINFNKINLLNLYFINDLESILKIKITEQNMSIIVNLYKQNAILLNNKIQEFIVSYPNFNKNENKNENENLYS